MLPGCAAMTNIIDRDTLIRNARKEYIDTGKTKSITHAFLWYLSANEKLFAGIPATITPLDVINPRTIFDEYILPKCKRCGSPMFWQGSCSTCRGPRKKNIWICKACGFKRMTKDTLLEAIAKLKPIKERALD